MSSIIKELAQGAGTKYPCRAKNPATCRVHGTFNPIALITDSAAAKRNLRVSEMLKTKASTFEDRIEAEMLVDKDQLLYDASLEGLRDLHSARWAAVRNVDKMTETQVKNRIAIARQYRADLLAANPVIQKIDQNYENLRTIPGAKTYDVPKRGFDALTIKELATTPYNTPVVLKLKDGGYIYDQSGDGITGGHANLRGLAKLVTRPHGFYHAPREGERTGYFDLVNTGVMVESRKIESVTVLPKDHKVDPRQLVTDVPIVESGARTAGYRGVIGEDFAFVGDMVQESHTTGSGQSTHWAVNDIGFYPRQNKIIDNVAIPIN